ncbi:hypothetical protein C8Q74DRAFT_1244625 [Fomes fomentarius]|nr:hypothetical protein C8Q74DRAFT_1244625 [Fomes fomentarius]
MAKKRPARRWFGRPTEGPGPQQTFEGQFQVDSPQAPLVGGSQQSFRVPPLAPSAPQDIPSVHRSVSVSGRGRRTRRDAAGSSRQDEYRPTMGTHNTPAPSSSARVGRLEASESAASEAGPSRRPRSSVAGHRATQSHPTVPTAQAAGGTFTRNRSHSSSMLASEMRSDGSVPFGEPSSWPRAMHPNPGYYPGYDDYLSPVSPAFYHGMSPQTPSTPGVARAQYSPPAQFQSLYPHAPSTTSLPLLSPTHYRQGSYELPDPSPTDASSWHGFSTPHTPNSMRGMSVAPSAQSAPSPYMDMMAGDFSPIFGPSDAAEQPPLTPDVPPQGILWADNPVMINTAYPQTVVTTAENHDLTRFGSGHFPQTQTGTSVSAPYFPHGNVFEVSEGILLPEYPYDASQDSSRSSMYTVRPSDSRGQSPTYSAPPGPPPGYSPSGYPSHGYPPPGY